MLSAIVRAAVTLCLAAHALFDDELAHERNRHPSPRCEKFQCPAFSRPVQKRGWKPWAYKTPEYDTYRQVHVDDESKRKAIEMVVAECSADRDICTHTCGMAVRECHERYMKCYMRYCRDDKECKDGGEAFNWNPWSKKDAVCEKWAEAQEEACDCVKEADFDASLKNRLIDFYQETNPEKLNKKGTDLKDKSVWKKWKGKRPEMFLELFQRYKKQAVELRDRETAEEKLAREAKSQNVDEEQRELRDRDALEQKLADAMQSENMDAEEVESSREEL